MSKLKVACLQLDLQKTDNLESILNSIEKTCKDHPSIELVVLSDLQLVAQGQ